MGTCAKLARRAVETETPVMVQVQELIRGAKRDVMSLAQGVVYWQPPEQALDKVKERVWEPSTSRYGADEGLPELRYALVQKGHGFDTTCLRHVDTDSTSIFCVCSKCILECLCMSETCVRHDTDTDRLRRENKLTRSSVMVTAGANQAFVNLVLTLCDAGDSVVMFAPYYFNAYMSFQMTGVTDILVGPSNPKTLQPDADWLERILMNKDKPVPKLVTVVNPGNPSGAYIPVPLLQRISDLCKAAGAWLVVDNTYEYFMYDGLEHFHIYLGVKPVQRRTGLTPKYFMYDGLEHSCIEDNHILNIFSFSKAYGMMGWRVGYIAYPTEVEGLGAQLLKIQDNIPICASIIGQHLALHSLEVGPQWIKDRVQDLVKNREILVKALSPLGEDAVKGGEGAIYLWAKLPDKYSDDFEVVRWLLNKHGVVVIPGSASGGPGYIRISFGGLKEPECEVAAQRLKNGLEELLKVGMV